MKHSDFKISMEFRNDCGLIFRVTDIGSRTIIAIRIDTIFVHTYKNDVESNSILSTSEAEAEGWFDGPPYTLKEQVFDENDFSSCEVVNIK